jgi:hypothetical protein
MRRKKKTCLLLAILLLASFVFSGAIFQTPEMTMDTEINPIYRNEPVEYFLLRQKTASDVVKKEYLNQYFVMLGKVKGRNADGKQLKLGMILNNASETLTCNAGSDEVAEAIKGLLLGDYVKVYGKMTMGVFDGKWTMTVDKVEKTFDKTISRTAYSALSGRTVDTEEMETRTLNNGAIKYYLPSGWSGVEKNLKTEKLGDLEGYQYRLNEAEDKAAYAESFFIGCVTKSDLVSINDLGDDRGLEAAIAADILGKDSLSGKYPVKTVNTYYGLTYRYYQDIFETSGGDRLNTEFIFQDAGDDHLLIFLYVYRDPRHLDEIMTVLRLAS